MALMICFPMDRLPVILVHEMFVEVSWHSSSSSLIPALKLKTVVLEL